MSEQGNARHSVHNAVFDIEKARYHLTDAMEQLSRIVSIEPDAKPWQDELGSVLLVLRGAEALLTASAERDFGSAEA